VLRIAAAVVLDEAGRMLVVRKAGTDAFMQPGGKLERDESGAECLARELDEELALAVSIAELRPLGRFEAPAANEAGWVVDAEVFRWAGFETRPAGAPQPARRIEVRAEIAEARWCSRAELLALAADGVLAPLTRDNLDAFLGSSIR